MHPAPASVAIPGYPAGTWKADPVHSEIAFSVRHLMISRVRGRFTGICRLRTLNVPQSPSGRRASRMVFRTLPWNR